MLSKFYYAKEFNPNENWDDWNVYEEGVGFDEGIEHDEFLCACICEEDAKRICEALEFKANNGWGGFYTPHSHIFS